MNWSPRVKMLKIRRLYRSIRLGVYDDAALKDVGSELYDRCADIVAVAGAFRDGLVPCPQCKVKVQRRINVRYYGGPLLPPDTDQQSTNFRNRHLKAWFHCPHCAKRLIWSELRKALRKKPRCFDCLSRLKGSDVLRCGCGRTWTLQAYRRSVGARVRLPCPNCNTIVRKPATTDSGQIDSKTSEPKSANQEFQCPKCKGSAFHVGSLVKCTQCDWERRWRAFLKEQKRRDEQLECPDCKHSFKWQTWRKDAGPLITGNPYPAQDFVTRWRQCRTPQERMMLIDFLLQTLHGQGPLAPMYIVGDEQSIRRLLDELSTA